LIVSTTVTVPNVNVRDLCNSMRQMFQNPRVQQIIPLGNANSVVMTGRGSEVAGWVHLLLALDADEGRAQAENAKHDAQRSPPKKDDSPPK
jgi:hypothetical protein